MWGHNTERRQKIKLASPGFPIESHCLIVIKCTSTEQVVHVNVNNYICTMKGDLQNAGPIDLC